MVTSAASGWPAVAPGSWPGSVRFLTTLNRAVALGDDPGRLAARVIPAIEFPPLANYTIRDAIIHIGTHNAHHLGQDHHPASGDGPLAAAFRQLDVVAEVPMNRRLILSFIFPVIAAAIVSAQAQFSDAVRAYIKLMRRSWP